MSDRSYDPAPDVTAGNQADEPKARPETLNCVWCGRQITVARKGPLPMYCSRAHKQLAYAKRRDSGLDAVLERAEADRQRFLEALEFYADGSNYEPDAGLVTSSGASSPVQEDGGRRARAALTPEQSAEGPAA